ncbi:hypothetical protein DFH08DRAFT_948699 [Mycena albidolilacea]|uniref:Uncharacterized protein n=1 Tax=Mycena albidolilacea TaxID=1033008 RepID=A0AAD7F558_9AGAR|nr:hypothetical protein DFH08DRAFT_948699 [Mycena albidolilacea]
MDVDEPSKHKRSRKDDSDRKGKKRSKHADEDSSRKHKKSKKLRVVDDDPDDDLWVEKNIDMDGERSVPVLNHHTTRRVASFNLKSAKFFLQTYTCSSPPS